MQFGAGPELAAQCSRAPTPDGWRPWLPETDGPIPDGLDKRAAALVADQGVPLGATESYPLPGVTTLMRVEPRVWAKDSQGALIEGCFRAAGLYLPTGAVTAPVSDDKISKTVGVLTAVSLVVGTVATLATWGRK